MQALSLRCHIGELYWLVDPTGICRCGPIANYLGIYAMTTIRLLPTEVQVAKTVFVFHDAHMADNFQACVAAVDAGYCEMRFVPTEKYEINQAQRNMTSDE